MVGTTQDDEERRAREKLLARRNSARATQKTTTRPINSRAPQTKKQPSISKSKKQQRDTIKEVSSSPGQEKDRKPQKQASEKRRDTKMSSNRGEASSAAAPPRGRHYRDEFGRQPPPHWDYPPNGHYHRGPPSHFRDRRDPCRDEGRWERDRGMHNALPPHPRSRRPRSPPRHREDRHYRDRRYRSRYSRSRSYSSRSRSRSFSSRGSSSSFSSSESDSGRSYDSRSLSRSRSRSYSRSPSPQSPVESKKQQEKESNSIDEKKTDDRSKDKDNAAKPQEVVVKNKEENNSLEVAEKKEVRNEAQSSSSSKESSPKNGKDALKRSRSPSPSEDSRDRLSRRGHDRKRKGSRKYSRSSRSRSRSSSITRSRSPASYSSSSSHSYSRHRRERRSKRRRRKQKSKGDKHLEDGFSKDQRTIFVSQLVMRTTERDLKKYFKRKVGCKVNDVILLRDRRNPRNHKGSAYVEVARIEDVAKALAVSGQPPDFQRFPILIKSSEAEKNYSSGGGSAATANLMTNMEGPVSSTVTAVTPTKNGYANGGQERQGSYSTSFLPPLRDENGRLIESQKVYVGGLDPSVRQDHLYALFSPFGNLKKVQLQCLPNTQVSRGFAFLTFHDPKVSNLAIRTMAGQMLAGRPLKTGWANQNQQSPASIASGCTIVTSDQFPDNASELTQKVLSVLAQMTGGNTMQTIPNASASAAASSSSSSPSNVTAIATMAEQELDKAMGLAGTSTAASVQSIPTVADSRASMGGTVAEARASLAADVAARQLAAATAVASVAAETKSAFIGNTSNGPTCHLLVRNMFDKDEETDPGWEAEIKDDFLEECSKFGKIEHAKVMHLELGGKIFATFSSAEGAKACAENLAGRWFDKRQLYVEYMPEENPP